MAGKRARNRASQPSTTVTATWKMNQNNLPEDLLLLTKDQLKAECRKRGQKTTGNKAELLQRLGHKMVNQSAKRKENVMPPSGGGGGSGSSGGGPKTNAANGSNLQRERTVSNSSTVSNSNKQLEKSERESLVLWRRPITTLEYFTKETVVLLYTYGQKLLQCRKVVFLLLISTVALTTLFKIAGPHQPMVQLFYKNIAWCVYWCGLGILSSVGLGTGLHTFLLYLGPHIAAVTIAAYECNSLNFPEPPYPDEIICPTTDEGSSVLITIFSIMSKVRVEAMCWGAGTALGELPPYFMARAARLSGYDPDDEGELKEFEELQRKQRNREDLTLLEKAKLGVEKMVERVGFFGILACASIPNPLFDLAGITCGHFLVPFWTFFGATLIGKAIIKMHIQKLFVIIAFNETLIEKAVVLLGVVPIVGSKLQEPFKEFLSNQKTRLHRKTGGPSTGSDAASGSILSAVFEKFVFLMIFYFVISIINSLAQSYHKRMCKSHKKGAFTNKIATD